MTIVCGYQGIGKTTYCKNHTDAYDLDSSNYKKDDGWTKLYVDDAIKTLHKGFNKVFISAHQNVVNELLSRNLPDITIVVAIPKENKKAWEARLRFRYEQCQKKYAFNALQDFLLNYDTDMQYYQKLKDNEKVSVIEVSARIYTNLSELL